MVLFASTRTPPTDSNTSFGNEVGFEDCILNGMAPDGGLYYPTVLPTLSNELISKWMAMKESQGLYKTIAFDTIALFSGDSIPLNDLRLIIETASDHFRLPNWTQIKELQNENTLFRVLELFHGPTFSFKDYSIMILGGLVNHFLKRSNRVGTALVATSGDTGSAAIAGLNKQSHARCVVLMPKGRISNVQQRMMTTVKSDRIKCLLVEGNFDDCQNLLKQGFADESFRDSTNLMAVNSVNFGRIICQMVYYFWATIVHQRPDRPAVSICVPTGNFGNILAAWYAQRMGAPIDRLIVASNRNDILPRFHHTGEYKPVPVTPTITPSIDIALSSNFERLIQYYTGQSTTPLYSNLVKEGKYGVDEACHRTFKSEFFAESVSEQDTLKAIARYWSDHRYIIDPHTAVGLVAAERFAATTGSQNVLVVATAHPAKFPEAVEAAVGANVLAVPSEIQKLLTLPEHMTVIPATLEAVKQNVEAFVSLP